MGVALRELGYKVTGPNGVHDPDIAENVLTMAYEVAEEFDAFVRDTTNFLAFIAEPIRQDRRKLGVWVLMFLIFFFILAVQLKKEIWKDVK